MSEFTNHNGILVHPEIYTYDYQGNTVDHVLPNHPDFPAAVEALTALVPEPFEWEITDRDWPRRWNGVRVERFDEVRDMWLDTGSEETAAFEAGRRYERERGQ